jgi:biopolymer transport protein ExbB
MTKIQASIKQGEIDEAIVSCDKQQGSVANAIKSALVKYQAVKKEGFNSEEEQRLFTKKSKRLLHLRCQCYKKHDNYFFFSFFRYLLLGC